MRGTAGYGRYNDDPDHVGCPRARSDMTPCVARDGASALADDDLCVGCSAGPHTLLEELAEVYPPANVDGRVSRADTAADRLRDLVREATEPERQETT